MNILELLIECERHGWELYKHDGDIITVDMRRARQGRKPRSRPTPRIMKSLMNLRNTLQPMLRKVDPEMILAGTVRIG